jgi:asparagine synthase (glutamine-hydrolysing)
MCGISGVIYRGYDKRSPDQTDSLLERLRKMSAVQGHRGPDGEGYWTEPGGTMGFGHRRLAVIDLSREADQPMHYLSRYTLVYNGEIFNYIEIRDELEKKGYRFNTRSDAEVLLASYDCYRESSVEHFDGMFAFAIWDDREKQLFAARDRFGEKPFYYAFNEREFLFASERKALWAAGLERSINHPLLINYLVLGNTRMPLDRTITFYQEAFSLPPAHYMKLSQEDLSFSLHCYWDCDKESPVRISDQEAVERWQELFTTAVKRRLRSDVSLGTSLSGGLDSSTVAATISRIQGNAGSLDTFSAVYPGFEKDESGFIGIIRDALNVRNFQVEPNPVSFARDFEKLCHFQEEPFASASVYAQYAVFRLAAEKGVTVLLDGQGADEVLAGYPKYIHWYLQELFRSKPWKVPGAIGQLKKTGIPFQWGIINWLAAFFPAQASQQLEQREVRKIAGDRWLDDEYRRVHFDRQSLFKPVVTKLNDILYFDTCQSGLEELLRYADRNSMAYGRELRLPFLSHELVEFSFRLPAALKIREGWTKYILRKSSQPFLPSEIVWRRDKTGYEPPQQQWMESPLVQEMINNAKNSLVREKILKPAVLDEKIQPRSAYEADNRDWRYLVAAAFLQDPSA